MYFTILFVFQLFTFETFKGIFFHRLIKEISKNVVFLKCVQNIRLPSYTHKSIYGLFILGCLYL